MVLLVSKRSSATSSHSAAVWPGGAVSHDVTGRRNAPLTRVAALIVAIAVTLLLHSVATGVFYPVAQDPACQYWVAPAPQGSDQNPGTLNSPWATMQHAEENVPDNGCVIWFQDGVYTNLNSLTRRFNTPVTFRAVTPYRAVFERAGTVVELDGAKDMIFQGFVFRHNSPSATKHVVIMDRRDDDIWTEDIIFRNNIFHDSYNNDLLKIHNGVRHVTVEGNLFYNQGSADQHIDVNSVTDIAIQDNIFFNDFTGSGRSVDFDTKHYIVIKDSNEGDDGLYGSRRITVRRNIFLNWEGENATFVQVGNDGKSYHEAVDVRVVNNLMIGNSPHEMTAAFGVRGARDVIFANNTVVGDLPAKSYALWLNITGQNPLNENLTFVNNIWSDPTATMGVDLGGGSGEFSDGPPSGSQQIILNRNLYWNGGATIPDGEILSPLADDAMRIVANPLLNTDHSNVVLPRWLGSRFVSGNATIREEFERLVWQYGALPASSPAVGQALRTHAPQDDILGRRRSGSPDLGAFEVVTEMPPGQYMLFLSIVKNNVDGALSSSPDKLPSNIERKAAGCRPRSASQHCHGPKRR